MPLPMVHLSIAERILESLGVASPSQFYLGAIAPDAIHMRPGWTRDEKRRVHLTACGKELAVRTAAALTWYRTCGNSENVDLLKKYVTHLLADNLWSHLFARYYHQGYSHSMDRRSAVQQYYRETETLDIHTFVTDVHADAVCRSLKEAAAEDVSDLVRGQEVQAWKQNVLATLQSYPTRGSTPTRHRERKH